MPGPGPHMMYTLGVGVGLMRLTSGRFGPHHCLFYAANAFLGPDLGSFAEWLSSTLGLSGSIGLLAMSFVHHPFYYPLLLGIPLAVFYSWLSAALRRRRILDSASAVPLSRRQCLMLVAAGSLSHFFLDHLFEENGHSSMYSWILSTGWWKSVAPNNPDAVVVIGFLCTCLVGGFIYINRFNDGKSIITKSNQSLRLIIVIASLYCMWCTIQIYLRNPPQPAIGEEADLGVLIFLESAGLISATGWNRRADKSWAINNTNPELEEHAPAGKTVIALHQGVFLNTYWLHNISYIRFIHYIKPLQQQALRIQYQDPFLSGLLKCINSVFDFYIKSFASSSILSQHQFSFNRNIVMNIKTTQSDHQFDA